ncbi:helix-turn-helix domain-containing protein [Spirosoma gilvum]
MVQVNYVILNEVDEAATRQQIGYLIRDIRLQADLTQNELAQQLGVSISTLHKYETNGQKIPMHILTKIAHLCHVNLVVGFQSKS